MAPRCLFDLMGGALCLDFANTLDERSGSRPTERLARYEDLVEWGRRRAVAPREAIYAVFSGVAAGRAARPEALGRLNEALAAALGRLRVVIVRAGGGLRWEWAGGEDDLLRVVWPVARSAAELLTSGAADSVRECAAETCGWLFLDRSRNRSRRWCDMKVCGNRSKARRYYQRRTRIISRGRPAFPSE